MSNVQRAWNNNLELARLATTDPDARRVWVDAMVYQIGGLDYFRWHSSGDLFSQAYADMVADVIRRTPDVMHWVPTKERNKVSTFAELPNVRVRLSAAMVDDLPIGSDGSAVGSDLESVEDLAWQAGNGSVVCPATLPTDHPDHVDGCASGCRACWSHDVPTVVYIKH